jgi:glucokinase
MQAVCAGIEIGGTKLQVVVGSPDGVILQRWRYPVDRSAGGKGIRASIQTALAELRRHYSIQGVGIGYGGPIDWRTGVVCCSHHVEGWSDFPLGPWVRELTQTPVWVDNDANVAALGEAYRGAGTGKDPVFYVTLGSGVGGGLVAGGRIYHGAVPGEAEIGHVRLDRSGAIIESRCSGWAVDARVRGVIGREPEGVLARLAAGVTGGEARVLGSAIESGDATARQLLDEVAEELGFGLSHVAHLMHPEVIVLGGGLSLLGEPLRLRVAEALPRFLMGAFLPGPAVVLASLREDAVPAGALLLCQRGDCGSLAT